MVFGQHAGARADEGVIRQADGAAGGLPQAAGRARAAGQLLGAGLHVGHALGGEWVAAQVRKSAVVVEARGGLQLVEHAHKALRVEAGGVHDAKANAVGLALHVARKIELVLNGHGLAAHNGRAGNVDVARGIGCQGAQNHGANDPRGLLPLAGDEARNMPLRDVGQLVRHDRGQLVGCADGGHEAQIHTQIPPGQGKGVDLAVTPHHDLPGKAFFELGGEVAALQGGLYQWLPQGLQVGANGGVVEIERVAENGARDLVANAALFGEGELGAIAQSG